MEFKELLEKKNSEIEILKKEYSRKILRDLGLAKRVYISGAEEHDVSHSSDFETDKDNKNTSSGYQYQYPKLTFDQIMQLKELEDEKKLYDPDYLMMNEIKNPELLYQVIGAIIIVISVFAGFIVIVNAFTGSDALVGFGVIISGLLFSLMFFAIGSILTLLKAIAISSNKK